MRMEIKVVSTLESRNASGLHNERTMELRRDAYAVGLIVEMENLWRVLRELAAIKGWIPTLYFRTLDDSRSIALREPAFDASERAERDRATTVLEALRKLSHG